MKYGVLSDQGLLIEHRICFAAKSGVSDRHGGSLGPLRIPTGVSTCFASALDQAQADKIRSNSNRAVCSDVHAEVARNNDYDDHDADDVKNVHGTLRLRDREKKAAKVSAAS
jgi:hypothetical protein